MLSKTGLKGKTNIKCFKGGVVVVNYNFRTKFNTPTINHAMSVISVSCTDDDLLYQDTETGKLDHCNTQMIFIANRSIMLTHADV
jgi:hypothetical protein